MKKVILFGTGGLGKRYLNKIGSENVIYFCDNDQSKWGQYFENIEIISPQRLAEECFKDRSIDIIISSTFIKDIYQQLKKLGLDQFVNIFSSPKVIRYITERYRVGNDEYCSGIYDDCYKEVFPYVKKEYLRVNLLNREEIYKKYIEEDELISIKALDNETWMKFNYNNETFEKNLTADRYEHFKLNKGDRIRIQAKKDIMVSYPINMQQNRKVNTKLTILIICDSLSQEVLNDPEIKNIMPNTMEFFCNGIRFKECYSAVDWTLPGMATIHSGKYPINHKLLKPQQEGQVIEGTLISEKYSKKGYLTSFFGSNWRSAPQYGYLSGVDRMIYIRGSHDGTSVELISNLMEHLRAFPNRSHFVVLNFMDLHHLMKDVNDIACQVKEDFEAHFYKDTYQGKSVFKTYDSIKAGIYKQEIAKLDNYLEILYSYLVKNYNDSMNVIFCADHGVSYLSPRKGGYLTPDFGLSLDRQMTHVPLWVRTKFTVGEEVEESTDNTCITGILEFLLENDSECINENIKNICRRDYAYNESIFPNQYYSATIIDENYEVLFVIKSVVSPECIINNNGDYYIEILERESGKIVTSKMLEEKYKKIVLRHIDEKNEIRYKSRNIEYDI